MLGKIRYKEIFRLANEYNYERVLTAHNYNDQLETLIMKDNDNALDFTNRNS